MECPPRQLHTLRTVIYEILQRIVISVHLDATPEHHMVELFQGVDDGVRLLLKNAPPPLSFRQLRRREGQRTFPAILVQLRDTHPDSVVTRITLDTKW